MTVKLLIVFIGLTFGGFVHQSFNPEPNFLITIERAYFQGWAFLIYWLTERFIWKDQEL